ncbi:MAG: GNAT family N-acetyltransferase [Ruminococcaceae bacterium]|nr:GNAT family N-acetyltransferase [Oscillospiraceae bacterium]
MKRNYWMGEKIRLRALEASDAESEYYAVTPESDSESERMGDSISFPVSPEHMNEVINEMSQHEPVDDEIWLIIEDMDGEVVGNINTHSCNRRMGHFRYGIDIGYRWRGMGYGREAVLLIMKYFFTELRYRKCTVGIYEFNEASVAFHESLGFKLEGRIRDMVFTNGRFYDEFYYGMTSDEFLELYGDTVSF